MHLSPEQLLARIEELGFGVFGFQGFGLKSSARNLSWAASAASRARTVSAAASARTSHTPAKATAIAWYFALDGFEGLVGQASDGGFGRHTVASGIGAASMTARIRATRAGSFFFPFRSWLATA